MNYNTKMKASTISGIAEVFATYPIDFLKTIRQSNKPISLFRSNPYRGVSARFAGVIPMRIIFWNTLHYSHQHKFNITQTALFTSSVQTLVDYPAEQISVRKMLYNAPYNKCFQKITLIPGFSATMMRNFGFAYIMNCCIVQENNNNFLNGAAGGLFGALLTHPLDSIKTHYHYNDTYKLPKYTLKQYYRGCSHRCIRCLVAMGIGWHVFNIIE